MSLGAGIAEIMRLRSEMKASGTSDGDLEAFTEKAVRGLWPFVRVWRYLCADCQDTGAIYRECTGEAMCGRDKRHLAHSFVEPCHCGLGARFRPRARQADDFTVAGKQAPKKTWTRAGR